VITAAKFFAVLGILAYAAGCYLIFGITALGNSPYWRTELGAFWHVATALAAIVFCVVAIATARRKPGEAVGWLLASAGIWVLGQLGHIGFLAVERPAPDFLTGLKGFGGAIVLYSIFTVPALVGALFAWLGSRNQGSKA
jgi:hypothetical protein